MADIYDEPPSKRLCPEPDSLGNHQTSSGLAADANVTLWQFLLDLLLKQQFSNIICWTNNDGEFKLLDAEQVAKLWGLRKNKHNMTYDKLSRALRYYYDKNIIKKVMGQKFVYKFVSFPEMVKTENRIPFKQKMESMINDSNMSLSSSNPPSAASSFQTLHQSDAKSGITQQAQHAAQLAIQAQLQALQQAKLVATLSDGHLRRFTVQKNNLTRHSKPVHIKTEALSPHSDCSQELSSHTYQSQFSHKLEESPLTLSESRTYNLNATHNGQLPKNRSAPGNLSSNPTTLADLSMTHPSSVAPLNAHTCEASLPNSAYDMSKTGTLIPPKSSNLSNEESHSNIQLEIPELDSTEISANSKTVNEPNNTEKPSLKHQKSKPDPLSISNDELSSDPIVNSPLAQRSMLPSLNTPMFLASPLFNSRTPLLPGLAFWPGTLSPLSTLSPRLPGGLQAPSAFQFPAFAMSPATLASFSHLNDNVFTTVGPATPTATRSSNGNKVFSS